MYSGWHGHPRRLWNTTIASRWAGGGQHTTHHSLRTAHHLRSTTYHHLTGEGLETAPRLRVGELRAT